MNAPITSPPTPPYHHSPLFPLGPDKTRYRKLDVGGVRVEKVMGRDVLVIEREDDYGRWRKPPSTTSITCCAPSTSSNCARSSTTRRRPRTTSSSPMTS